MKWILFIPELYYLLMAAVFFALAMIGRPNPKRDFSVALSLAAAGLLVCIGTVKSEGTLFYGVYRVDLFSQIFKVMIGTGLFLVASLCSELAGIRGHRHSEFYLLLTTCTLGMMMLVSSVELLTLYIALELTSYSLYIMVPLRKGDGVHMEAGIKYFLIGAATSAVMLFGLASLYGATRTTYVVELVQVLPKVIATPMAFMGLLLTLGLHGPASHPVWVFL
jgi:NADH-quinone oxidoreductase subunit N